MPLYRCPRIAGRPVDISWTQSSSSSSSSSSMAFDSRGAPEVRETRSVDCARFERLDSIVVGFELTDFSRIVLLPSDRSRVPSQPGIVSVWKLHTLHRITV
ncbi:uncharacterized protein LOC143154146 [Ptiloglossa arizonensis]|uniref:uncharacterized protein LOC143154146 n=1 Tax=Ptiloglossa arizonensis TaxID=3350558 RepID=UPI003FA14B38